MVEPTKILLIQPNRFVSVRKFSRSSLDFGTLGVFNHFFSHDEKTCFLKKELIGFTNVKIVFGYENLISNCLGCEITFCFFLFVDLKASDVCSFLSQFELHHSSSFIFGALEIQFRGASEASVSWPIGTFVFIEMSLSSISDCFVHPSFFPSIPNHFLVFSFQEIIGQLL